MIERIGVPYGSRTRVAAVKGRCPRPLDERDALSASLSGKRSCYGNVAEKVVSNRAVSNARFVGRWSFLHVASMKCTRFSDRQTDRTKLPKARKSDPLNHTK